MPLKGVFKIQIIYLKKWYDYPFNISFVEVKKWQEELTR